MKHTHSHGFKCIKCGHMGGSREFCPTCGHRHLEIKRKEKNPFFLAVYRHRNWMNSCYVWDASVFRCVFAGGRQKKLPQNFVTLHGIAYSSDGTFAVQLRLLPYEGKRRKGAAKHRVQTYCDRCDTWVYAGRIAQHKC